MLQSPRYIINRFPDVITLLCSFAGGIYFGLNSCGGYIWHKPLFCILVLMAAIYCILCKAGKTASIRYRFFFFIGVWLAFLAGEVFSAPFYPSMPESLKAYLNGVIYALEHGPC